MPLFPASSGALAVKLLRPFTNYGQVKIQVEDINMSWDIALFNSKQKIKSIEELDETQLEPTDFCSAFESHFDHIRKEDNYREIKGKDFAISYFIDDDKVSNKMVSLYGENGLYELVQLANRYNWQIFDTGIGQMIDLENPANNGYENFQIYLRHVLKQ